MLNVSLVQLVIKDILDTDCYLCVLYVQIALYFAFLGMYTNWLVFPAVTGTLFFLVDFG